MVPPPREILGLSVHDTRVFRPDADTIASSTAEDTTHGATSRTAESAMLAGAKEQDGFGSSSDDLAGDVSGRPTVRFGLILVR
jgi:hypothetical protein